MRLALISTGGGVLVGQRSGLYVQGSPQSTVTISRGMSPLASETRKPGGARARQEPSEASNRPELLAVMARALSPLLSR